MARKPSAISTFLEQAENLQKKAAEETPAFQEIAKKTEQAKQQQIKSTQAKEQKVREETAAPKIAEAGGIKYDTSTYTQPAVQQAYTPAQPVEQFQPTSQPISPSAQLSTALTAAPQIQSIESTVSGLKEGAKVAGEQAIQNMGEVRKVFLDKGMDEAKKTYKELFGQDMPSNIESQFGTGLEGIKEYLQEPTTGFGQFRELSKAEQQAQEQAKLADITGSSLYGLQSGAKALETQAGLPQIQQAIQAGAKTQEQARLQENLKQQSIADYLEAQAAGKANIADYEKEVAENTNKELDKLQSILTESEGKTRLQLTQDVLGKQDSALKGSIDSLTKQLNQGFKDIDADKAEAGPLSIKTLDDFEAILNSYKGMLGTQQYKQAIQKVNNLRTKLNDKLASFNTRKVEKEAKEKEEADIQRIKAEQALYAIAHPFGLKLDNIRDFLISPTIPAMEFRL